MKKKIKKMSLPKTKTLGVCGDSWFSPTQNIEGRPECENSEGKHFSELLARRMNYNLFNLAKGACSNSCIRLQISEVVKRKVDFIIIGTTTAPRIDYPKRTDKEFDPSAGIYNCTYSHQPDQSALEFDPEKETLYSDTLSNIVSRPQGSNSGPTRDAAQRTAIRDYYLHIYDENFKAQQDAWIIANGIQEIRDSKIPYLLLSQMDIQYAHRIKNNKREIFNDSTHRRMIPSTWPIQGNRRWHTTDRTQIDITQKIYTYILANNLLES